MKCPKCERIARFSPEEKMKAKENGSIYHLCKCGTWYEVSYADTLSARDRLDELRAVGKCVHCGKRMADEGYVSCKKCRDRKAIEFSWTKSIANEEKERKEKTKKEKKIGLDELSKMAHDKNISYGTLSAIMEGRMKMPKDSE